MDNQVNIDELREVENAGTEFTSTPAVEEGAPTEPVTAEPASDADVESAQTEEAPVAQGQSPTKSDDVSAPKSDPLEWLKDTPYKEPAELVKGYKELQSLHSKTTEKMRPYKDIIDRMEGDLGLRTFISQALQGYDNPEMLKAYEGPITEPNPANYDLVDPEQQAKYKSDLAAHLQRITDQRINQRLMQVEQNAKLDAAKNEFRAKYPGEDPDEVIKFARDKGQNWTLDDIRKIQKFDQIRSEALAEARKEVTKQLETAQKSKAPTTSTTGSTAIRAEDVLKHLSQYGSESTRKKYGDKRVLEVLHEAV